jgi:hypothetical protein
MDIFLDVYAVGKEAALFEQAVDEQKIILKVERSATTLGLLRQGHLTAAKVINAGIGSLAAPLVETYGIKREMSVELLKYSARLNQEVCSTNPVHIWAAKNESGENETRTINEQQLVSCVQKVRYEQNGKIIEEPWTTEVASRLTGKKYTLFDDRVDTFNGLMLRGAMVSNAKETVNPENMRKAIAGEEEGPFSVIRMRLQVAGTLTGIRTLVRAFDDAYKVPVSKAGQQKDNYMGKRIYVIKSIALYAEQDGAREIFRRHEEESGIKSTLHTAASEQRSANVTRRGRGRGRGRAHIEEQQSSDRQTEQQAAEARAAELKRQQEEANKPFHQRDGYGDVQIGADKRCRAVIDFDCYELK